MIAIEAAKDTDALWVYLCLEFTVSQSLWSGLGRGMTQAIPVGKFVTGSDSAKILSNDNFNSVLDIYTTKSKHWAYKREWRVLYKEAGTNYTYQP